MKLTSFHLNGKKNFITLTAIIFTALALTSCRTKETAAAKYFESMNTFMKVQCYGDNAEAANEEAQKLIGSLEKLISVTKPESEIYALNHAESYPVEVSEKTAGLLKTALSIAENSDGAFNPCLYPVTSIWGFTKKSYRIPPQSELDKLLKLCNWRNVKIEGNKVTAQPGMMFDLGGIGKGFAGDEAIKVLKQYGIESALLDLGGNIQTIGTKPDGTDWTIGIKNPFEEGAIGALKTSAGAVITSGGYERFFIGDDGKRYIHIFDGSTGRPVDNNVQSATAIGATGTYCDGLSTTLFVLGPERAVQFWKKNPDFDFIIITSDKTIWLTKGIEKSFELLVGEDAGFKIKVIE